MIRVKEDLLFVNWNKHLVESGDYTQQEVSDLFCPDGLHLTGDPMKTDNNVWTVNPDNKEERWPSITGIGGRLSAGISKSGRKIMESIKIQMRFLIQGLQ